MQIAIVTIHADSMDELDESTCHVDQELNGALHRYIEGNDLKKDLIQIRFNLAELHDKNTGKKLCLGAFWSKDLEAADE
jgi:hypothetical protein